MSLIERFVECFDVWEEARPYIDVMVEEDEMRLIVGMGGEEITVAGAAELLGLAPEQAEALLERAYQRGVLHRRREGDAAMYAPADFYTRLDFFVRAGAWKSLPAEARRALDRRCLREFIEKKRPVLEKRMLGEEPAEGLHNDAVLLLSDVEEMVEAAGEIIVLPCDCRLLGERCDRPIEVCIWMDDLAREMLDRGHGRRLTREQARDLLRSADRKGLMHTGDPDWRAHGLSAICNCCACDCYPFRAARELNTKGIWPASRYMALHGRELCTSCGACVRRCHFGAFYHDGSVVEVEGESRRGVAFDPEKCWGCGLCANACPSGAIVMVALEG